MKFFNRRNKIEAAPKSFYELAETAEAHEDCLILVAVPKTPYTPDEADINEADLGRVIYEAIGDYFASLDIAKSEYETDPDDSGIEIWELHDEIS
jgi:hypothetical protein